MFRFFYTYDLISELEKELKRDHKIVQIMIDDFDFFLISKALLNGIESGLIVEIVIVSTNNKKSMKLVNLCKRLIDMNAEIYWKVDKNLFAKEDYFAIFDKEYLISKKEQPVFENQESLVKLKIEFFNGLALASKKLTLFDGEINIEFHANKSIIYPKDKVLISWDVKNAHEVEIDPIIKVVESSGQKWLILEEDTKFTLSANNKGNVQKKSLFIRVLKIKEIEFDVEVFDPILKEYISINSVPENQGNYAVFIGQLVKISWNIKMIGKLIEPRLGNLPLFGSHEFEIFSNTQLNFTFKSLNNTDKKTISLHCFENEEISSSKTNKYSKEIKSLESISILKKTISFVLNIFR